MLNPGFCIKCALAISALFVQLYPPCVLAKASQLQDVEHAYESVFSHFSKETCAGMIECLRDESLPHRQAFLDFNKKFGLSIRDISSVGLVYYVRAVVLETFGLPIVFNSDVKSRLSHGVPAAFVENRYSKLGNEPIGIFKFEAMQAEPVQAFLNSRNTSHLRVDPSIDRQLHSEFYSPSLTTKSIRPGTIYYDANGAMWVVVEVSTETRTIKFLRTFQSWTFAKTQTDPKSHTRYRMPLIKKFRQVHGEGFKNWRPYMLSETDYASIRFLPDSQISNASLEQYSLCNDKSEGCNSAQQAVQRIFN